MGSVAILVILLFYQLLKIMLIKIFRQVTVTALCLAACVQVPAQGMYRNNKTTGRVGCQKMKKEEKYFSEKRKRLWRKKDIHASQRAFQVPVTYPVTFILSQASLLANITSMLCPRESVSLGMTNKRVYGTMKSLDNKGSYRLAYYDKEWKGYPVLQNVISFLKSEQRSFKVLNRRFARGYKEVHSPGYFVMAPFQNFGKNLLSAIEAQQIDADLLFYLVVEHNALDYTEIEIDEIVLVAKNKTTKALQMMNIHYPQVVKQAANTHSRAGAFILKNNFGFEAPIPSIPLLNTETEKTDHKSLNAESGKPYLYTIFLGNGSLLQNIRQYLTYRDRAKFRTLSKACRNEAKWVEPGRAEAYDSIHSKLNYNKIADFLALSPALTKEQTKRQTDHILHAFLGAFRRILLEVFTERPGLFAACLARDPQITLSYAGDNLWHDELKELLIKVGRGDLINKLPNRGVRIAKQIQSVVASSAIYPDSEYFVTFGLFERIAAGGVWW